MKNNKIFYASALVMLMASCGTQKMATQTTVAPAPAPVAPATTYAAPQELSEQGGEVISMAEAEPFKRQWGVGQHLKLQYAIRFAEGEARGKFAAALQMVIEQSLEDFAKTDETGTVNPNADAMAQVIQDFVANSKADIGAISKESVKNTYTVKTQRYRLPNGMYEVYACLEDRTDNETLAKNVAAEITQRIPQSVKDEIGFQQHLYEEKIKEKMKDYKSVSE